MSVTLRFEGGRALEAALRDLSRATAKNVTRRALRAAAEPILDVYKGNTKKVTGNLVESEVIGTKLTRRQAAMARRLGKSEVEIHVGTSDPAGIQEEFGGRQAAHPALRPAWAAQGGNRALERIADSMKAEIGKATARAARRAGRSS